MTSLLHITPFQATNPLIWRRLFLCTICLLETTCFSVSSADGKKNKKVQFSALVVRVENQSSSTCSYRAFGGVGRGEQGRAGAQVLAKVCSLSSACSCQAFGGVGWGEQGRAGAQVLARVCSLWQRLVWVWPSFFVPGSVPRNRWGDPQIKTLK